MPARALAKAPSRIGPGRPRSSVVLEVALDRAQGVEHGSGVPEHDLACGREAHSCALAREQPAPGGGLQHTHALGDRRLRVTEFARGRGERAALRDGAQDREVDRRQIEHASLGMLARSNSRRRHEWVALSSAACPPRNCIVETLDGSRMPAILAWPDQGAGPWPVAVVLGELFGLTDVQRDAAERVAALGHVAIAPHLLHRRAPGGPLPEDEDGRARGLALVEELTRLELLSDVRDALDSARARPQADAATTPVAVGLSFGGHVAVLAASQLKLRACVALYAGWLAGTAIAPRAHSPPAASRSRGRCSSWSGTPIRWCPPPTWRRSAGGTPTRTS